MRDTDRKPVITAYTIQGAAGRISKSGVAHHDMQATAWAALGAVTAARWDRLELRQRRAGEFELEGFSDPDRRSGIYTLTVGEVAPDPLPSDGAEHASRPVPLSPSRRESWAEWMPGATAALTRSELAAAVNLELDQPITASVIAEWEREGVLPMPMGQPGGPRYPEAASQTVLLLIALDRSGRAHLDMLEVVRNAARDVHAGIDLVTTTTSGG